MLPTSDNDTASVSLWVVLHLVRQRMLAMWTPCLTLNDVVFAAHNIQESCVLIMTITKLVYTQTNKGGVVLCFVSLLFAILRQQSVVVLV